MKKVTVKQDKQNPLHTAENEAIKHGFNCYSKPGKSSGLTDHKTNNGDVFYFSWHSKLLEVTVKK